MSRAHVLMMLICLSLGASCATSPYSGQQIPKGTIDFGGFVDEPGATIRFSAWDWYANMWMPVQSVTSSTKPSLVAGAICPNSPALYSYTGSAWLQWSIFWKKASGLYEAKVRARKLGVSQQDLFFTASSDGVGCILANATPDCDFFHIAHNVCGYSLTEATVKSTSSRPWL